MRKTKIVWKYIKKILRRIIRKTTTLHTKTKWLYRGYYYKYNKKTTKMMSQWLTPEDINSFEYKGKKVFDRTRVFVCANKPKARHRMLFWEKIRASLLFPRS